jgi:hypothetical protein
MMLEYDLNSHVGAEPLGVGFTTFAAAMLLLMDI